MSVVSSDKISVRLRLAQRLPSIGSIRTVVDVERVGPKSSSNTLAVIYKAAATVHKGAGFPGVVGGWAADDDFSALRNDCLAGLDQIERVCINGCGHAVVCRLAGLCALAGAYRAAVVSW